MSLDPARFEHAAAVIAPAAAQAEREGRHTAEAVAALAATGVFKTLVPEAYGGGGGSLVPYVTGIERAARIDGSAGWLAMIGATSGLVAAYLPDDVAREAFEAPDALACGVFAPTGRAVRDGDALRVRGRWSWASGCEHARWRVVGVVMHDGAKPITDAAGAPETRCVLLRAEETRVVPNWDVPGLRATGSHDLAVDDVIVPADRCFSLLGPARDPSPVYRVSAFGTLAAGVAAVALGIAGAAVERFVALAREKTPSGARRTLAHRELVQLAVAVAVARVRAARLYLHDAARSAGTDNSLDARAALRLAACHVTKESVVAVDLVCNAAGAGAARTGEPLERMFRDVHMAAQHAMVADAVTVVAGRVGLGLDTDASML